MASPSGIDGFAEVTLQSSDPDALAGSYTDVVGLELLDPQDDRIWLKVGERARLGLWSPGEKEFGDRGGRHVHFAFRVTGEGLERLRDRLAGEDAEAHIEEHPGGDRSLPFTNPEGNRIEAWTFFHRPQNAQNGVKALRG